MNMEIHNHSLPLPKGVGDFFIANSLYARGSDFSELSDLSRHGQSLLKKIWQSAPSETLKNFDQIKIISIKEDVPCGVLVWLQHAPLRIDVVRGQEALPVASLGAVMAFVLPEYRRRGLATSALLKMGQEIMPRAELEHQNGYMPIVSATGAMQILIARHLHIPTTSCLKVNQSPVLTRDVWSYFPQDKYLTSEKWWIHPVLTPTPQTFSCKS